jgi:hypothetical protein
MNYTKQLFAACMMGMLCFFFISCNKKENDPKKAALKKIIDQNLGTKLKLPKDLTLYTPFSNYKADSAQIAQAKLKIYSHVNTSCATCVQNITNWNNMALTFSQYNVPIILVCTSKDNYKLIQYLCETKKEIKSFPYPFFLDPKKDFVDSNSFMREHEHLETVLTDKNGNILVMGNPSHSESIYKLYESEIQKRHKKQPIVVSGKPAGTN